MFKNIKLLKLNSSGLGILSVLAFTALLSIIIVALMNQTLFGEKNTAKQIDSEKMIEFADSLRLRMKNIDDCARLFYPNSFQVLPANFNRPNTRNNIRLNLDGNILSTAASQNTIPNTNIRLRSIFLTPLSPSMSPDPGTMVRPANPPGGGNPLNYRRIRLRLGFEPIGFPWSYRKSDNAIDLTFNYFRTAAGTNVLLSCYSEDSMASICQLSGGYPVPIHFYRAIGYPPDMTAGLHPSLPRNLYSCQPLQECAVFRAYAGAVNSAHLCRMPYKPVAIGPTWYQCQWCNENY